MSQFKPQQDIELGPYTTLEIGGPAKWYAEVSSEDEVCEALAWAKKKGVEVIVLGGGSNVLIADAGLNALVIRVRIEGIRYRKGELIVGAGENWDDFVAYTVERGFAGVECLSGIPGDVGAAPMQNIGAYGQEVSSSISLVRCIRRSDGEVVEFANEECEFAYRQSHFKQAGRDAYIVTQVRFKLELNGTPQVAYAELERAMLGRPRTLALVREAVIELRADKSMVLIDKEDPNHRSVGSFFVNPNVEATQLATLEKPAEEAAPGQEIPRFEVDTANNVPAA
ncbi:MAG: UDP-N-acetylmuramate dehydrogenase, partial [Myxococcota bacterium]